METQYDKKFLTTHLANWQKSDYSKAQYCRKNNLKVSRFYKNMSHLRPDLLGDYTHGRSKRHSPPKIFTNILLQASTWTGDYIAIGSSIPGLW